tara:strand:- start:9349 stop:11388 length:2040 start_codon:yes stop_codon:yes gene_type:complete
MTNATSAREPQPWDTPESLLLFVVRHQPTGYEKEFGLTQAAVSLVDAADLTQACESVRLMKSPERQVKAQKRQITKLIYTDRTNLALELARKMESPSQRGAALNQIAQILINEGDVPQARAIAKQMTDLKSKAKVIRAIARTLKSQADIEQALNEGRALIAADERDLTLCCVVVQLANKDEIRQATALMPEIRSEDQQKIAAGALAGANIRAGQIGSAISLIRQGGVDPYDTLRYEISHKLVKSNNIEQALEVALEIETLNYQSSMIYSIAKKLMELHQFQRAQEVILLINKTAQNKKEEKERFSALASFAGLLLEHSNLDQIKDFATHVDIEVFRYYKFFEKLIEKQISQGKLEQALQLTETFPEADIFAAVSLHLAKQGQFKQALEIALKIKDGYHRSAALAPLVVQLLKANELDQAFMVLQKMDDTGFQCTGPESRRYHDSPHHWHPDKYVYEKMIEKLLEADKLDQALEVPQMLHEPKEKCVYTEHLVEELIKMEKHKEAIDVALNFTADAKFKSRLLRTATSYLIKAGEFQQARKLTQQIPYLELRAEVHYLLAYQLTQKLDFIQSHEVRVSASKIIKKIEHTSLIPECTRKLVTALIKAGELPQATTIACRIEEDPEKLPALYEVTRELTKGSPLKYKPTNQKGTFHDHKLKTTFTPEEQQLARQIVATIQDD